MKDFQTLDEAYDYADTMAYWFAGCRRTRTYHILNRCLLKDLNDLGELDYSVGKTVDLMRFNEPQNLYHTIGKTEFWTLGVKIRDTFNIIQSARKIGDRSKTVFAPWVLILNEETGYSLVPDQAKFAQYLPRKGQEEYHAIRLMTVPFGAMLITSPENIPA